MNDSSSSNQLIAYFFILQITIATFIYLLTSRYKKILNIDKTVYKKSAGGAKRRKPPLTRHLEKHKKIKTCLKIVNGLTDFKTTQKFMEPLR
jgi:hypothetical protein